MLHIDFKSRLKAAAGYQDSESTKNAAASIMTLGDALESVMPDAVARYKFMEQVITPEIFKLVRTPDIQNLRIATVADRMAELRNPNTPFLNFLESKGAPERALDYQYKINNWDIGTTAAEAFPIEDDLPSESKTSILSSTNTVTAVGTVIKNGLLTLNMANQQSGIDYLAKVVNDAVLRVRRQMNSMLLNNTEVKGEAVGQIPQLGGFVTRSTSYNVSTGGADLSRPVLQGRVGAIANDTANNGLGFNIQLMAITGQNQLQVIRDIILSEYSGITPESRMMFEDTLKRQLVDYKVNVQTVFESLPGPVIPFVLDSDMPSGTTIIFDPTYPRLVKMFLGNMEGPYVMARPTEKLQRLDVVFDLFTLEDPLVASRAVVTGTP